MDFSNTEILILLYFLVGAWYSYGWCTQQDRMQLPVWRYCLQLVMALTGWPWLWVTEWNMDDAFHRFMEEHTSDIMDELKVRNEVVRNGTMLELDLEKAEKFQKFLEELMAEDVEEGLTDEEEDV